MTAVATNKIRLLVADDHHILLDGLVSLLKQEENFSRIDTAEDGQQVIDLATANQYDLCLLDISMPGVDGMAAAKWIRANQPELKVIILTTHDEAEIIAEMLHNGVSGYLLKNSTRQQLVTAINRVMSGKTFFSDEINTALLQGYANEQQNTRDKETVMLTQREMEIVQLLSRELTNEKIANELHISYRTVETHRKNIMQKTKAHNLAGLIKFAYSNGLIK